MKIWMNEDREKGVDGERKKNVCNMERMKEDEREERTNVVEKERSVNVVERVRECMENRRDGRGKEGMK